MAQDSGGKLTRFAVLAGFIATARKDGSIPLNSQAVAKVEDNPFALERAEALCREHAEMAGLLRRVVSLWPVPDGMDRPKAHPDVLAVWTEARAILARIEGE